MSFPYLLLTLNAPLQIDKCTRRGTCTPGWEPLHYAIRKRSKPQLFAW